MRNMFLAACISLVSSCCILPAEEQSIDFAHAYENEQLWPAFVKPGEKVLDSDGNKLLDANIPVVLIRAYENGDLAVVDRIGAIIIDYQLTNFLELVEKEAANPSTTGTRILLNQLARRIFDASQNKTKALSEVALSEYDHFLIVKTSSKPEALTKTVELLRKIKEPLEASNTRPILIFDELMQNEEFHNAVTEFDLQYPVFVPIFQKGAMQALYSPKETDKAVLLLNLHGKLLASYDSMADCAASFSQDKQALRN